MTQEQIKICADTFKNLGLSELSIKDKDFELVLKKEKNVVVSRNNETLNNQVMNIDNSMEQVANGENLIGESTIVDNTTEGVKETTKVDTGNCNTVKAPLVGIYYSAPSPDAEAFVKEGDHVNKGDVLCIIEAMKMFNEIKAEVSGKIVKICTSNGNIVEYGQDLFVIENN